MAVYIIAEAGVNHNGDIGLAKKLIDMASECGADAIKFQTFKAEESTGRTAEKAEYQKRNDGENNSQLEMIRHLELPFEAFAELKRYAENKEIDFISTPDGAESLKCLSDLNVSIIKIGSTEVTNPFFLKQIAKTRKSIILSTGMSNLGEVEKAINILEKNGTTQLQLMHCTTDYPTEISEVNLKAMLTLKYAFQLPVGYSDHTLGFETAIAATALGACCIEKHITLDKDLKGPDHRASMNPIEFKEYVQYIRNTEILLGTGRKKPTQNEQKIIPQVRRSILAAKDLRKGTVLTEELLCCKRPGTGISPEYMNVLVGREIKRDIKEEEMISWQDV